MGMDGNMTQEQRLAELQSMLGDAMDQIQEVKSLAKKLDAKTSDMDKSISLCVNYCRDISRRLVADAQLRSTVSSDAATEPPPPDTNRAEAITQPDLPKPSEDT